MPSAINFLPEVLAQLGLLLVLQLQHVIKSFYNLLYELGLEKDASVFHLILGYGCLLVELLLQEVANAGLGPLLCAVRLGLHVLLVVNEELECPGHVLDFIDISRRNADGTRGVALRSYLQVELLRVFLVSHESYNEIRVGLDGGQSSLDLLRSEGQVEAVFYHQLVLEHVDHLLEAGVLLGSHLDRR